MIQLARHRGQTTVVDCAHRVITPGSYTHEEYNQIRMQAVAEMLKESNFVGKEVVSALGWDELQVRNLRIPTMPEEEVAEVIRFEAAERFGLDPDDSEIRFLVAGDVRQGTDIRQEVIVLGTGGSAINQHLNMLSSMELHPVAIDAGPNAIFRSFERFLRRDEDLGKVNTFVDLGYAATRVVMSRGPELVFFKSIPIGGRRFDELVSEQLNLSITEAAQIRIRLYNQHVAALAGQSQGLSRDELVDENIQRAVLDALRPALEQLSKEIALCLRYCSVTFRGIRSEAVTVVGGEACNTDITQLLSDQVNIPFKIGRPMRNIGFDPEATGIDRRTGQPEWATALGLALKPVTQLAEVAS